MTRRSFLTNLGALGLFTILPGAGRVWRAERPPVLSMQEQWIRALFYGEPLSVQVGVCRFEDLQSVSFIQTPDDWMDNFRAKSHDHP